jgi:tRNA A-37 threonylcarbamoyl transferase component Bud32
MDQKIITQISKVTTDDPIFIANLFKDDTKESVNNKDLLIVSLLEYVCSVNNKSNKVFYVICKYLQENDIIDTDDIYSLEYSYLREIYMKVVGSLVNHDSFDKIKQNSSDDMVGEKGLTTINNLSCTSRYRSDFIEIEKLGKGGFGTVYKVYNKLDKNLYAIKKIHIKNLHIKNLLSEQKVSSRRQHEQIDFYLAEAQHLSVLNHPNIVRYFGTWIEFDNQTLTLFIQMELCDTSLSEYLDNRNYSGTETDVDIDKKIFKQIIDAIRYIHSQDIIHRDLTPKNIFLDKSLNVKIGDFGLSRLSEEDKLLTIDDSYGNMIYMSPEESDDYKCSQKSDTYSLGIIYFELLTQFKTMMERMISISSLKNKEWDKFDYLDNTDLEIIKKMTENDYMERPDISDLLI